MQSPVSRLLALCLGLLVTASPLLAQERRWGGRRPVRGERPDRAEKADDDKKKVQSYDEVIPEDAKSDPGLFLVHHVDDDLYYEIPVETLDRDLLWVIQVAKTGTGHGYGGSPVRNRVVRFELRDDDVLLRGVEYRLRASEGEHVRRAVESSSVAPILAKFPVKAWGKDKAPVIQVTDLFLGDSIPELSAARRLGASGVDKSRSFLESVKSFPTNIETRVLATYRLSRGGQSGGTPQRPDPRQRRRGGDPGDSAVTALVHHSMVELPDDPMRPRVHDERVGFFTVSFEDYGTDEHGVDETRYVTRWRLEPKDPEAEVSDPKEPIVFYVGREVPAKWRPYVKEGIEMWQPAFEAAGFSNAILAKDAPSPNEDPDWDAEDARYASIRWLPSTVENAMGPHVHDPRTGEILEADVLLYHNVLKLVRDWYFVQASPMDERAQELPLPDDLVGELLAYVVAHEVGHSLGFPHNMKASSSYTVEQLRDPEFTAKHGTEASIMDYGRFNYVAQPGDGARLIPTVGPYDFFAVEWGYRWYANDRAERKGLSSIVSRQVDDPMLRFGNADPREDPSRQTEDLGADPIAATELGLANIDRIAGYLVEATCEEGEDYDLLRNMYDRLMRQRDRELGHVTAVVGGVRHEPLWYGDADRVYHPVGAPRQREAVSFLVANCFETPTKLIAPEIRARLEADGAADLVLRSQRSVIRSLVSDSRLKRMSELAEQGLETVYLPVDLMTDLRQGIFRELGEAPVRVDFFRRNLQRAYVDHLTDELDPTDAASDLPALARGELELLEERIAEAIAAGTADRTTRLHLHDLEARIERALDPAAPRDAGGPQTPSFPFPTGG